MTNRSRFTLFDTSVVYRTQVKTFTVARSLLRSGLEQVRVLPAYRTEETRQLRQRIALAVVEIRRSGGQFSLPPELGLATRHSALH